MSILKVTEVSRYICNTNMGTLWLKLRKGTSEYIFVLDAVELDKNTNKELMQLLYPIKQDISIQETKISTGTGLKITALSNPYTEPTPITQIKISPNTSKEEVIDIKGAKQNKDGTVTLKTKGGRPVGSKNTKKK